MVFATAVEYNLENTTQTKSQTKASIRYLSTTSFEITAIFFVAKNFVLDTTFIVKTRTVNLRSEM